MRGKLGEDLKVQVVHSAGALTATSMTFGKGSIDTRGYKEMMVVLNVGDVLSSTTFAAKLYENSADDFTTAVPVTSGALISTMSSSDDQTTKIGNVLTEQRQRYMWLGAMASGTYGSSATQSVNFGCTVILGKGKEHPESQTLTVDLG
jgi:hypothetical protein